MSDWLIRHGVPEDIDCIASMWLRQLCKGQDATATGYRDARTKGSDSEVWYWQENEPIVGGLIRSATVLVACDPDRSTYEAAYPAVIWAWAVMDGDYIYGVGVKRTAARSGIAEYIVRDLLGDRLDRPQSFVMDLVDLRNLRLLPSAWRKEEHWMSSMRRLSQARIAADETFLAAARHIVDPERVPWVPSSKRAA